MQLNRRSKDLSTSTRFAFIQQHPISRLLPLLLGIVLLAGCSGPGKYITVGVVGGLSMMGVESEVVVPESDMSVAEAPAADESQDENRNAASTREPAPEAEPKPTPVPEKPGVTTAEVVEMLDGGKWVMVHDRMDPVSAASAEVEITVALGDGRISGSAGCNRFNGGYRLDGNRIQIAGISTTRMACPPEIMEQERAFLDFLESATMVEQEENQLILVADEERMGFERATE